jgi:hypothetical protein
MRHMIDSRCSRFIPAVGMICLIALSGLTARGGELNPKHIPADAKWVIHVNYDAMSGSALWQKLRDEKLGSQQDGAGQQNFGALIRAWTKDMYGIELPDDLNSVTMYSRDYKEYTGTMIVKAKYAADKIERLLIQSPNHRASQWQDHTLHTVTLAKQQRPGQAGQQEMTVVMVDPDTLLMASSVDKAQAVLKLLEGEGDSLEGKDSPLLGDRVEKAWIYGAAIDLKELEQHPASMPILSQHERICWSFGKQEDGRLYEEAKLVAQSPEVAEEMKKVIDGLVAYLKLFSDGNETLVSLIDNTEVKIEDKTTSFNWHGTQEEVLSAVGELMKRFGNGAKPERA